MQRHAAALRVGLAAAPAAPVVAASAAQGLPRQPRLDAGTLAAQPRFAAPAAHTVVLRPLRRLRSASPAAQLRQAWLLSLSELT